MLVKLMESREIPWFYVMLFDGLQLLERSQKEIQENRIARPVFGQRILYL
jgi:hypothetical protein